jgi:hypothetical protein
MGQRDALRPNVGSGELKVDASNGDRVPVLGAGPIGPQRGVVEKEKAQITSR